MRIGIDLHMINNFMQGSRTYVYNLTRSLIEKDRANEYYLYFTKETSELPSILCHPNVHKKTIYPSTRIIRLPFAFPIALASHGVDVFHCQYMGPPFTFTPYVVTLHDILHEIYPEFYPHFLRFFMSVFYPFSARRAAKVLAVSEYSKKTIVKIYGLPEEKVEVTYDAVCNDEFRPIRDKALTDHILKKYQIHGNYILFVGRLEPRKNISGIIKAFHSLRVHHDIAQKLVIVGMKDFLYQRIFDTAKHLKLGKEIIFTGRVEQEDLPILYNGADFFVYPSFAEGFGVPPLEAMACGIPVITSNTTSLPEVVGDAGILVDPQNIDELSQAMYMLIKDADLRGKMKNRGLERSKLFSWHRTADKVLRIYEEVYEDSCRKGQ
jgi:glycosyltransferase involved in cell wall biosynthesis